MLLRRPDLVRPGEREDLLRRLDALEPPPWLDPGDAEALRALVLAWRPVATGEVPDPFAFDRVLQAARGRWRVVERRLRAETGAVRGAPWGG